MNVCARVYYVVSPAYLDTYYCLHSGILISESDLLHSAKFGGLGVNYLEVKLTPSSEIKKVYFLCWIQSPDGDCPTTIGHLDMTTISDLLVSEYLPCWTRTSLQQQSHASSTTSYDVHCRGGSAIHHFISVHLVG